MTEDRSETNDGASKPDWDPQKWRPSSSFHSTGFSPDSGYSRPGGEGGLPPSQRRSVGRGALMLVLFIVAVILVGAAGLYKLVQLLRG